MDRYAYSENTIQQLKKKQITFFILMGTFICLTLFYILFIGKTLDLGTFNNVLFFLFVIALTAGSSFYMVKLFETLLRQQYFVVTDTEIQKVVNGQVTASILTQQLTDIKSSQKGVQLVSKTPNETLFIPNTLDHYQDLLAALEKRVR